MEPAVSGISLYKPLEELLRHLAQFHKGLSHRFKPVAYLFRFEVTRVLHFFTGPCRLSFMVRYQLQFGRVDQDLPLRSLNAQYIGYVAGGY